MCRGVPGGPADGMGSSEGVEAVNGFFAFFVEEIRLAPRLRAATRSTSCRGLLRNSPDVGNAAL